MRITVVGGSGFIGTHLAATLVQRGHAVRLFDLRPSPSFESLRVHGDCADAGALAVALRDADCVVDLAAPQGSRMRDATGYLQRTVAGVHSLIEAAGTAGVPRILFNSSVAVYGPLRSAAPEDSPLSPATAHARGKCAAEAAYRTWAAAEATRSLVIVRPSVVFGEGNRGNVHRLIEQLQCNRFVMVGNGRNRKSIAYVGNLVDFLCSCLDEPPGIHCFNYADPPPLATSALVGEILALLPGARRPPRVPGALALAADRLFGAATAVLPGAGDLGEGRVRSFLAETVVDTSAADARGFERRFTLQDGLRRTIAALRDRRG